MIREISIVPVLNGWIVRVGCQTVVFTSADALLGALRRYLEDPIATEEQFLQTAVNARWVGTRGLSFDNNPNVGAGVPPAASSVLRSIPKGPLL